MNDDFDSNKPEEAVSDAPEGFSDEPHATCPECGSENVSLITIDGDDHKLHEELTCNACGYTETN